MEILGVGPLELFFILIIALIVMGPNDMAKAGRTLGRFMRSVVTSPGWGALREVSHQIRVLPNKLMREAGLEEQDLKMLDPRQIRKQTGIDDFQKEVANINRQVQGDFSAWTDSAPDPQIAPPALDQPGASPASDNSQTGEPPAGAAAADHPTETPGA